MKEYENVFLGLILAGVLMMVIGLGLMMTPARSSDGARVVFASKQAIERPGTSTTQPIYLAFRGSAPQSVNAQAALLTTTVKADGTNTATGR